MSIKGTEQTHKIVNRNEISFLLYFIYAEFCLNLQRRYVNVMFVVTIGIYKVSIGIYQCSGNNQTSKVLGTGR